MNAMIEGYLHAGKEVYLLAMHTMRHPVPAERLANLYKDIFAFSTVDVDNSVHFIGTLKNFLFSRKPNHAERFYHASFQKKLAEVLEAFKPEVTFTAPWCGHCTSLLPELQLAAFQLHEEAVEAKIGHYDVTAPGNAVAAGRQHIDGYPTIVLYRRGQRTGTYEGGRSHRDIHEYLRKRSGALFTPISTLREVVEHTTQVRLPGRLHTSFRPLGTPTAPLLLPRAPGVLGGIRERCGHLR